MERRLSAILAADVVGYSRMMEVDEANTFERLRAHRKELFEPKIEEHHGRVFKLTGDGLLAEFASVVDAVECAVALQRAMAERNKDVSPDRCIDIRIGINLGDVIVEGEDRYGEGVNMAARLQALADPGGIAVSGTVVEHARNKLGFPFDSLGQHYVKNIAEPVSVYRVLMDPAAVGKTINPARKFPRSWRWPALSAGVLMFAVAAGTAAWLRPWEPKPDLAAIEGEMLPLPDKPSIAVLPFANMSDDPQQEFFADGLTEDLIFDLSNLSGLFIISRNTAFTYKDQVVQPQQIATDLGVGFVLNGSVRRSANRVRITATLIDALNDRQIWAGRYDRELTDIFAVQDEVKKEIITALKVELTPGERTQVTTTATKNIDAYEFYLRGRYAMNLLTGRALRVAYYAFERAIALDPNFADAHAELAMTYALDFPGTSNFWNDWVRPPGRARAQAEILARKAAAINPSLAVPDLVLARLALAELRYDNALDHARSAVEREPGNSETHATLALALTAAGQHIEAKQAIEEALRRDPKAAPSTHATLGIIQFALRDYEAASRSLDLSFKDMVGGGNWFFGAFSIAVAGYRGNDNTHEAIGLIFWGAGLAAVRLSHFYRDAADMEHLLEGLRIAGVPEFPPQFDPEQEEAKPVTEAELKNLLSDREFETLCWSPRLNGEFRFTAGGSFTWTVRHDLTDTGTSRIEGSKLCVTMPVITRNREACYSVFEVEGDNHLTRDYDYAFAGPMLCYFRAKEVKP